MPCGVASRMIASIRNHPIRAAAGALTVLGGLAWLAFGFFGVHTLFIDDVVAESAPVFDAQVAVADPSDATPVTEPDTGTEPSEPATTSDTVSPDTTIASDVPAEGPTTTEPPVDAPAEQQVEIATERVGTFVDGAHPTSGRVTVLGDGTGQRFLRFEDFETDNGPDLNVYLVSSETGDIVDLGDLNGNIGDQNYEIPVDVDLDVYDQVSIWCVRFGVGFGSADLTPA